MNRFIFDVDGTLTPSRDIIDHEFAYWFYNFQQKNDVYLVTGSDKAKTIEQIGPSLYDACKRVYNCNGNDVWEGDTNIRSNDWILGKDEELFLKTYIDDSPFPFRTGAHIEDRPGMCNFSVVGRNANTKERWMYTEFDKASNERNAIALEFNEKFPDLQATVGGETGIDIAPKGADKSQILQDFDDNDFIIFFGDRMDEGGNDYPLALANYNGENYHVKDWKHTWKILRREYI